MIESIVIGIGHKKGHGKDTVADFLVREHGFKKFSWAGPLKQACGNIFNFSHEQLHGNLKETVDPYWGKSPREILQIVGTDLLRDQLFKDIWVKATFARIKVEEELFGPHGRFVIPDTRFPEEADAILCLPRGEVWKVTRSLPENEFSSHASETALDLFDSWSLELDNNGTLEHLYNQVKQTMKTLE